MTAVADGARSARWAKRSCTASVVTATSLRRAVRSAVPRASLPLLAAHTPPPPSPPRAPPQPAPPSAHTAPQRTSLAPPLARPGDPPLAAPSARTPHRTLHGHRTAPPPHQ